MNEKFEAKRREVQEAIINYLIWFETCPLLMEDPETRLPKIKWDSSGDDPAARKHLIKLVRLLGKLRCHVEIWSQRQPGGHEYSEYGYAIPNPEDPTRAATSLYNLTRGCALKLGRNNITIEDIHIAIKVALSTASQERIAVLDLLLKKKVGAITVSTIAEALSMSKSTALKTMTELEAVGIADLETVSVGGNDTKQIRLQNEFNWLYQEEFLKLRGNYNPVDQSKYDIEYQKDPKIEAFWSKYGELEGTSGNGSVDEIKLKDTLLNDTSGIFTGPIEIEILIKKMIQSGEILYGIQGLCRKDARTTIMKVESNAEGV